MCYIYQASLWCDDCIAKLRPTLTVPEGADLQDEHTFDSDDYPKYAGTDGGEADSPQHCDGCHAPLDNPLTSDGVKYVLEAVRESLEQAVTKGRAQAWDTLESDGWYKGSRHVEIVRDWAKQIDDYSLESDEQTIVNLFLELSEKP